MIIRPPRFTYSPNELGPRSFVVGSIPVERDDYVLVNLRGLTLQVSHWQAAVPPKRAWPCVIYCHGNGGGRVDALDCVRALLPASISVVAFDFSGSGLSEGQYVSLGAFEKEDLEVVIKHLRQKRALSDVTIGLWGRSMGAVTSLLYASKDPSIAALVLDSPFASFSSMANDLAKMVLPKISKAVRAFFVRLTLAVLRRSILKRAQFDISTLEITTAVTQCLIPALFVHAQQDTFVWPHHSELLFQMYAGEKNLVMVNGDHNSQRPQFFIDSAAIFFINTLLGDEQLPVPSTDDSGYHFGASLPNENYLASRSAEQKGWNSDQVGLLQHDSMAVFTVHHS